MKVLLDTNVLLWLLYDDKKKVSPEIRKLINDDSTKLYVSICSIWEVEIKHLKKPELMPIDGDELFEALTDTDVQVLNVKYAYINQLKKIAEEKIHYDPFDQMLIASAISEDLTIVTSDSQIVKYNLVNVIQC